MHIRFLGAAEEVTGSCHLIETSGRRLLVDCGLIQGSRKEGARNRGPFPFRPDAIQADLVRWYRAFQGHVPAIRVHGEAAARLRENPAIDLRIGRAVEKVVLVRARG